MSLYWSEARVVVREAREEGLPATDAVAIELRPEALDDLYLMRLIRGFVLTLALGRSRVPDEPEEGTGAGAPAGAAWDEPVTDGDGSGEGDFERGFMRAWGEAEEAWERECASLDEFVLGEGAGPQKPFSAQIQVFVSACGNVTVSGEA